MRLPVLKQAEFSARQRELAARIAGKRGQVRGPFLVWLHSPELCDRVEALGAYVRYDCSLPDKLREFSILLTARHWDAQHSWNAHLDKAIAAGIPAAALRAIAEHQHPHFDSVDEQVFYDFCMEMLEEHFVSDATFTAALRQFGNQGVVDIIGCLGNFSMLAMCLNAFQVDLDPTRAPPYPDVRGFGRIAPRPAKAPAT
ncbi:MAG: carboxymuconolactone decarboxylase family protein [Gammaproteobacteria bacterium]|nr:carboxymuconolactone decarboxylase family protein [Gammaproteobacteria bacterium]MDE2250168.1 carboxymuconolactone decarboxylase family protein [Gammaproteobacteria bacterium]